MVSMSKDLKQTAEYVVSYLEKHESNFVSLWENSLLIHDDDMFKDKVRDNGYQMYTLVKSLLLNNISVESVKQLAHKLAQERFEANINIGDFVYNVNVGRSILIRYIIESGINNDALGELIGKLNSHFDAFSFHAVTKYTELKDNDIREKTVFIQQSHKDRLAILGQISSSFVHEFRNPLTSIIGFNKLLRNELPSHRYLDIIDHELDQLNFRITQFLHTSKMNATKNRPEKVELSSLLNEILQFLYPSIVDGDVNVVTYFQPEVLVEADREELKQVFLNILFNSIDAVKQSDHKREIHVHCQQNEGMAKVKVLNNGPAIPPDVQETIFEPFFTTKELGTGIGLFVCRKIVEKYHGTISCESNDKETAFSICMKVPTT